MKAKEYGNESGVIFTVYEEKLDLNIIRQLQNYLDAKENEIKKRKRSSFCGISY